MTVRLLQGDCREVLKGLPDKSVQCVVTSFFTGNATILLYHAGMEKDTRIKKGQRLSPATEFKSGEHWRQHAPHWEREWLVHEYVTLGRSAGEIAAGAGTTAEAIFYWLRKHDIPRRNISGARAIKRWGASGEANGMFGKFGDANPNYVDGRTPERQRLSSRSIGKAFLRDVRARDGGRCVRCGTGQIGKRLLHVHHIRPLKDNPALWLVMENAITLCPPCHLWVHSRANTDKDYLA